MKQSLVRSYVFIRSKSDTDATVRLQSDPVLRGLRAEVGVRAEAIVPAMLHTVAEGSCLLFHYDDFEAIAAVRQIKAKSDNITVICFGSDIYSFDTYLDVHEITDFYIMPTELHCRILASQVYKPVYHLPEHVDPISGSHLKENYKFPLKESTKAFWFGYSESFYKSMSSLMPLIKNGISDKKLAAFDLILDEETFENHFSLPTLSYSNSTFQSNAAHYDYCILSHFSLDLAVNSYIKSPNKLITALMVGVIPIASDTPNYRMILSEFGLERLLFQSASELKNIIYNLDPVADSKTIRSSGIAETLMERYSDASLTTGFTAIHSNFDSRLPSSKLNIQPGVMPVERVRESDTRFKDHVVDLFPSALRAIRKRFGHV